MHIQRHNATQGDCTTLVNGGHSADTEAALAVKITDSVVRKLSPPAKGSKVFYDSDLPGFGCRVTANGIMAFVLNYRTKTGIERRFTIGRFPNWSADAARKEARNIKAKVDLGGDPAGSLTEKREAPTLRDLCDQYERDHLPKKRVSSQIDDRAMIRNQIAGSGLMNRKVADITFADIDGLHRKVSAQTPYRANRMAALLSKMFGLSIRWGMRRDNPAVGIERNQEMKRHRYLDGRELKALSAALDDHSDRQAADIIRLLLLTGARRGEVLTMCWADVDLEQGTWTKPGSTTKQKTSHRVPLSSAAIALLSAIYAQSKGASGIQEITVPSFVFAGRAGHRKDIKSNWAKICEVADIKNARLHDLRHTYASVLASAGMSLPIIGALLGHTQAQTTMRYSHLFDDPLRQATEKVSDAFEGKASAIIVPFKRTQL